MVFASFFAMEESYLDISKSVMISSPAGSGKTEKLARRYIALLKNGSDVERILAITFTEKAAAEMKERIIKILEREDPEMFDRVREKMPRMRISTIHAFCLKLLKRFCLELDMDPSLEVMDSFNADMLWNESVYESLLEDGESGEKLFYDVIRGGGVKGWTKLHNMLNELHSKRPNIEFGFNKRDVTPEPDRFQNILSVYSRCLERYRQKKKERHSLDYNDLELLAYESITMNPEWQNVLFAFDEHTDHLLVDEFQDTSSLQWRIIDKLTEEWRSGLGSKRDKGIRPTIFLVGDDKQSIYSFRGANVSIFRNAKERLNEWLGDEYHFMEAKENYRSLPAIVDFVNTLFGKLMPKGLYDHWKVEYSPFEATREGRGGVELCLLEGIGDTKENRKAEASVMAKKIRALAGKYEINRREGKKACGYEDMAVLLRGRTHLSIFEDALRKEGVPFVVVKGIGFYNTPEIGTMKGLLFVLIDPLDDYSLFNVLRSPLFSIDYGSLLDILAKRSSDTAAGFLYNELNSRCQSENTSAPSQKSLWESGAEGGGDSLLAGAMNSINRWLLRANEVPFAILLEEVLEETGAWQYFHERQRYVNVKKFIKLVEEFESKGLAGVEIREKLVKASAKSDEAKANVNTEGMDAVKIMTVHACKGLQFPMVFLPCLDEGNRTRTGSIVMDEEGDTTLIGCEEDSEVRKNTSIFRRHKEKVQEEEKRLFYVAATRAMDYLCMSGVLNKKPTGKLAYLLDSYELSSVCDLPADKKLPFEIEKFSSEDLEKLLGRPEVAGRSDARLRIRDVKTFSDVPVFLYPLDYRPSEIWSDVTEEIDDIRKKHGDDWIVLGRAFHRVFEGLSKGQITHDNLEKKTVEVLGNEVLSDRRLRVMKDIVLSCIGRLDKEGYLNTIMLPQEKAYTELPFILETGGRIYKSRIDRVIIKEAGSQQEPEVGAEAVVHHLEVAHIYDYKTYPVEEGEMPALSKRYAFQMKIYREAVERLFNLKAESYLFFTHEARLVRIA